ncbi:MAG: CehA/McbA family metallohydrolase [Bacteroidetes bacterium]|nr:CehA/McbA family metallohydrolase [Bacteroidota bacterium]
MIKLTSIFKSLMFAPLFITTIVKAQSYNYYFGNIHAHSSYSDGNQDSLSSQMTTPFQDFTYAKQSQHVDFYGISDHNHAQAGMVSPTYFHKGLRQADSANVDGTFVALYGMEWGVISGGGHVLVYGYDSLIGWEANNYDVYVAKNDYRSLWKKINAKNGAFAYLAHPNTGDYDNILATSVSQIADNAIIGLAARSGPANSSNTTYSNPSTSNNITDYNNALRQGYHTGAGLDHDTHNSVFGRQSAGRLVVLATSLTRANILDGLKRMRFYSSDDWNVKINFSINAQPMGSIYTQAGSPTLSVSISDPDGENTSSITVYYGIPGSGSSPTALTSSSNTNTLTYAHTINNNTSYYYYIRVVQADGNTMWTSPIWYKRNDAVTNNAPVAAFSSTADTICPGQEITLMDNSWNSPTSWSWSMPGGTSSTSSFQNTNVSYSATGNYQVTLVTTNSNGSSASVTRTIVVGPPVTPSITVNGNTLTSSSTVNNQWFYNNTIINGATGQSYIATQPGDYYVRVGNSFCFSNSDTLNLNTINGVKENSSLASINVFPNPTNGLVTIELNEFSAGSFLVEVINMAGQLITNKWVNDCATQCKIAIDLSIYPKGEYVVKIRTIKGSLTKKIMLK